KPAERMEEMKFDMCGGAAVIGTIEAAAKLELPVKITGAIPSTDNLPGGSAYKPGDIITMMSGKTVEIVNTDAEGRMILGDALHYASELKPDHILDYATLTGACVVALGSEATGLFSNNDELARKLIECGERVGARGPRRRRRRRAGDGRISRVAVALLIGASLFACDRRGKTVQTAPPPAEQPFTAIDSPSLQFLPRQQEAGIWKLEEDP